MSRRYVRSAGLLAVMLPLAASAQDSSNDPVRNWAAITQCAEIDAVEQRHQCMDDVLQRSGLLSRERVVEAARQDFGRQARPATPRPPEPARDTSASQPAASPPTRAQDIEELVTTVAAVRTVGYRRLVVTTAEGSVWRQTQAETFTTPPKPGDRFVIQQAAFNSYRCQFGNGSRYRCERAD